MPASKTNKRTIRIFGLASFFNDMGSDMIYPIWPLFLTEVMGVNLAVLGLIDGLGDAVVSLSRAFSGYLSDRLKRRKVFIWLGYLFGGISRVGYALATSWHYILPLRILDRSGKIRSAPRDAIIADISDHQNRGKSFGFLRMMDNLGAVFGILICVFFFQYLGYTNLFLLAAIPSLLAVILILVFVKEKKEYVSHKIFKGISFKDFSGNFRLFTFLSVIFALGSFSYSFLLIFASAMGFSVGFVPVLYLLFTFIASVFSFPAGYLADKFGRKPLLFLSFFFWGLLCLLFIISGSKLIVILGFILFGLHKGILDTVQNTLVSELAPKEFRASGMGAFQMLIGFTAFPASLFAGLLWENISVAAPFYFSFGLTIVAMLILPFVRDN